MVIDIQLKRQCVDALNSGVRHRVIYDTIFHPQHPQMSFETFRHRLNEWQAKRMADDITLSLGTYENFVAHGATVQVNNKGAIVQAWIKQKADEEQWLKQVLEAIKENTTPNMVIRQKIEAKDKMLEINLADMHFGLANNYSGVQNEMINLICSTNYDEINIVIGQDLLHNDDFRGRTSKGTPIEKINMGEAWNSAKAFWSAIAEYSLIHAKKVNLVYVKGNHDESLSWAFVQMLKVMFPMLNVDDGLNVRKAIYWKGCFIGLTHGAETMNKPNDLRGQFTIAFPTEFANAKVREIHCSHLHHEKEADLYGVMVRRLSTANIEDEWSDNSGYIGAHKRFMIFEYAPNRLKAIHYLYV